MSKAANLNVSALDPNGTIYEAIKELRYLTEDNGPDGFRVVHFGTMNGRESWLYEQILCEIERQRVAT